MTRKKQKQKIILPPELPEIAEDDIEISDEDVEFVKQNKDYSGFVIGIDTDSINKHVNRVADVDDAQLEAKYEERLKKKALKKEEIGEKEAVVQQFDALPVKTLDGQLYYRKLSEKEKDSKDGEGDNENEADDDAKDSSVVKLSKADRRAKLKKLKKEAKRQGKDLVKQEEVQQTPQAAVLAEVKEDLTAEETFENKKRKLAELGTVLLEDPESNIKSLREMFQLCKDDNYTIVKLALLSLLTVFKDIIPGYRIRLPTEKELEMKVSKEIKKMRYYESTLLSTYKGYLLRLITLESQPKFQHVTVRCICSLLEAVPHFNFREHLLTVAVKNVGSADDTIRKLSCSAIKSLFTNEAKHGGEATIEAVQLIADHVKAQNCQLHPDSIEVFMSLSIKEDLGKDVEEDKDKNVKNKKNKKRKFAKETNKLLENDRKRSKEEMMIQMREEVAADYKAAAFMPNVKELRKMQSEILSAVFETYFRILKHTMQSITASSEEKDTSVASSSGSHPLLTSCLNGLGKFSHLIDLDYIGDLMNYLNKLAGGGGSNSSSEKSLKSLSVSERLQCCIVAFRVMRSNLDALNVDLHDFFVQLYNLILEYRPGRDKGEVLAEALKIMLCEDRQHDMQKAAAFVKRLATFSLCFGSAESMSALVTVKHLLHKNVKCRNLLENDAGGGSVAGSIAKYQPYSTDPNLSGALASVLWELNLLSSHYHPAVSTLASSISGMNKTQNQVHVSVASPLQAFTDFSIEMESFNPKHNIGRSNKKRKRDGASLKLAGAEDSSSVDEDALAKKLSDHFVLLRDIKASERLRVELDRTNFSLQLYEEYKKQKKKQKKRKIIRS